MKKNFALLMMVVLVLGFAACDNKPVVGTPVSINDHAPIKEAWRGIVTGKVETFGHWALIQVENPKDNQDYQFKMTVVFYFQAAPAMMGLRDLAVGEEIFFTKTQATSVAFAAPGFFDGTSCLGLFRAYAKNPWIDEKTIVNPSKK